MTVPPRQFQPSLLQVDAILTRLRGAPALAEICRFLRSEFSHFSWVGIYRLDGLELHAEGSEGESGPPAPSDPLGSGARGKAAADRRPANLPDLSAATDYAPLDPQSRSAVIVPVLLAGATVGQIVVESRAPGAFDPSDLRFLGSVGAKLAGPLSEPRTLPLL
ncbi:MAG: GAF domain-containing protein [Thermoplasmata archaeon]|nr:GAF domain-containing protein [Thermoplasmata archaeon]